MKNKMKIFQFTIQVVRWMCLNLTIKPSLPIHHFVALCDKLDLIMRSRGLISTIKYVKSVRSNLMNYLSGNPLRDPLSKCTKDGIPVVLGDLIPLIRSGHNRLLAFVLTVLTSTRSLKIKTEPNTETITQPWTGEVTNLLMWRRQFWKDLGYSPAISTPRSLKANTKLFRLSNGPNGHALNTALIDLGNLPKELVKSLGVLGGDRFKFNIEAMQIPALRDGFLSRYMTVKSEKRNSIRRIASFPDKEGKMRVIGILDYYSQIALKPLHLYLKRVLERIPQDCTLDQSKFTSLILGKGIYYSVDLSAATDRFPIQVIMGVLGAQLPTSYVDAWKDVMVGYPFDYSARKLIYNTGNPMGAYSSFNSFALAHHYIIYYVCKSLGKSWKTLPYALLGDDIVIADKDVGERYMEVIKSLGLEVSSLKTHKSKDLFEFAKRVYYKDQEITPFPISALKECGKSFGMMTTLLIETEKKGWVFPDVSSSVGHYFGVVKNLPSSIQKKRAEQAWLFEGVLRTVQGLQPANIFLNEYARRLNLPLPALSDDVCKNIFANCAVEAFSTSNIVSYFHFKFKDMPLTKVASEIQMEYIKWSRGLPYHVQFPSYYLNSFNILDMPLIQAALAVSELYGNLEREITKVDSTGGDWTYYMRNFCLPKTDKSILQRTDYVMARTVNSFVTLLEERLYTLVMYPSLLDM